MKWESSERWGWWGYMGTTLWKFLNGNSGVSEKSVYNAPSGKPRKAFDPSGDVIP